VAELIAGMFSGSRYKRSQGRMARQATFFAIVAAVAVGVWQLSNGATTEGWAWVVPDAMEANFSPRIVGQYIVPALLLALGAWAAFRIVNMPRFADFLISVEAEMSKVSWPSRGELFRASMVVIVVIFLLTTILFGYDLILRAIIGWFLGSETE
jgi:preprotein translocase subunit SecE